MVDDGKFSFLVIFLILKHIEIHQRYFIKWNGEEIHSVVNEKAQQFYDVKVYASDLDLV